MFKPNKLLLFFFLAFPAFVFAEESITITTYYPSPYGSYNELYVAGKLGIGTTGPTTGSRLHIVQPSYQFIDLAVESALPSIRLVDTETNQVSYGFEVDGNNLYIDAHTYANRYENTYGSPLVTLQSSGNVGIGTTPKTWDAWYNVMQIGAGGFLFGHDTAPASAGFGSNVYISSGYKRVGVGQATLIDTEGGTFTFMVAPSGAADSAISWTNAMTILNSNGNVGIGTTGPNAKFEVNDGGGNAVRIGETGIGTWPSAYLNVFNMDQGNGIDVLRVGTNLVTAMTVNNLGNVGIGTTNPVGKLDVNGSLASTNWTNVSFASGWANYGGAYQTVQYKKFGDLVFMRGLANSGGNPWSSYPTIFTLPSGFRPQYRLIFCQQGANCTAVRIDITSSGNVFWDNCSGGAGSGWISLDGIVFSVD